MTENPFESPRADTKAPRIWRFYARGTTERRRRYAAGVGLLFALSLSLILFILFIFATQLGDRVLERAIESYLKRESVLPAIYVGLGIAIPEAGIVLAALIARSAMPRKYRNLTRGLLWALAMLPAPFRRPRLADRRAGH